MPCFKILFPDSLSDTFKNFVVVSGEAVEYKLSEVSKESFSEVLKNLVLVVVVFVK